MKRIAGKRNRCPATSSARSRIERIEQRLGPMPEWLREMLEISYSIPASALRSLPKDGAENYRDYLYGQRKPNP